MSLPLGDALGTASALESLSRVVAPSVGGWMLGALGTWSPGILGGLILIALAGFSWWQLIAQSARVPAVAAG